MIDTFKIASEAASSRFCHQNALELADMLDVIIELNPKVYLEIGTFYAGGAWAVQQVVPNTKLYCVDNCSLDTDINTTHWLKKNEVNATYLNRDSQQESTANELRTLLIDGVDFLFIDGDHNYHAVKRDWELYLPLVNKGGVVAFHDIIPYSVPAVAELWEEIKPNYKTTEIIYHNVSLGVGLVWL